MMKTWKFLIYLIPAALLLTSCSGKAAEETAGQEVQEAGKNTEAASKEDDADETSEKDFGKNIIPKMLSLNMRVFAYQFEGYWKDVGTLKSLWEANMDLLGVNPVFALDGDAWKIYSGNNAYPPALFLNDGSANNSIVTEGDIIAGKVINSVIGEGVTIEEGAVVENSVVFSGSVIGAGSRVSYAIIDEDVQIGAGCVLGDKKSSPDRITLVGRNTVLPDGTAIESGSVTEAE